MCNEFVQYQAQHGSGAWNSSVLAVSVSAGFPDSAQILTLPLAFQIHENTCLGRQQQTQDTSCIVQCHLACLSAKGNVKLLISSFNMSKFQTWGKTIKGGESSNNACGSHWSRMQRFVALSKSWSQEDGTLLNFTLLTEVAWICFSLSQMYKSRRGEKTR